MAKDFNLIKEKWEEILLHTREINEMPDVTYDLWIAPLELYDSIGDQLIILVKMKQFLSMIRKRYTDTLHRDSLHRRGRFKRTLSKEKSGRTAWTGGGLKKCQPEFSLYLRQLCSRFLQRLSPCSLCGSSGNARRTV